MTFPFTKLSVLIFTNLEISNYMIYHRELNHEKIVDAWKRQFFSVPADIKVILLYVANEVIIQTSRKGKLDYVKDFGDSFIECFKDIIRYSIPFILGKLKTWTF